MLTRNAESIDQTTGYFDSDDDTVAGSDSETGLLEKQDSQQPNLKPLVPLRTFLIDSDRLRCLPSGLLYTLRLCWLCLVPSFTRLPHTSTSKTNSGVVSALDGLRGLACLFVFNEHVAYNYSDTFLYGYGVENRRTIVQWPFIRVFWSGLSMVSVFYVISGYVLAYKPLQQIRTKNMTGFQKTLAFSVLRRALRLYLPTITAVLICGFLLQLGIFNYANQLYRKDDNYLRLHEPLPPTIDGFWAQMWDALKSGCRMLNVWTWKEDVSAGNYDLHTWTIADEFRSSMVLFLILVGTSRLKQISRVAVSLLLIIFCIMTQRKDILLFTSGMFLAELDLMRKSTRSTLLPINHSQQLSRLMDERSLGWLVMFVLGVYLASIPTIGSQATPGFMTLRSMVPCFEDPAIFVRAVGAVLITWSVANSERLNPIFTNKFVSYLGKISYSLYLVHGNVLKSVGYAAMPALYSLMGDGTRASIDMTGFVIIWLLGNLLVLPITFYLSDVFWRCVDMPSVRVARWMEEQLCDEFDDEVMGVAKASLA